MVEWYKTNMLLLEYWVISHSWRSTIQQVSAPRSMMQFKDWKIDSNRYKHRVTYQWWHRTIYAQVTLAVWIIQYELVMVYIKWNSGQCDMWRWSFIQTKLSWNPQCRVQSSIQIQVNSRVELLQNWWWCRHRTCMHLYRSRYPFTKDIVAKR